MNPQSNTRRATIGRTTALLAIALLAALGPTAIALAGASNDQSGKPETRAEVEKALVGTWRLDSFPVTDQNGDVTRSLFDDPVGKVTYTPQGEFWAFVGARATLTGPGSQLWYTGRLEVRARAHEVVHHVEYASLPGVAGTKLIRQYDLRRDRLVLSFPVNDTETAHGHFVRVR